MKTLLDTGSEVSVISEHILDELKEVNKNIPSLPVAGVTIVGITGVRSKQVTKQVQLNMVINGGEYENTFLVVRGLNLEVILGNDFLIECFKVRRYWGGYLFDFSVLGSRTGKSSNVIQVRSQSLDRG